MPYLGSEPAQSALVSADITDDIISTAKLNDNAITTAKLNDDAITLAKMAAGTDGNIISYDASGNPVAIATGNDGQVLTSTGAGSPPAFEAAAGGAWNLISTAVASSSASLTITGIDSTYDTYAVIGSDLVPATDGTDPILRLGDSSGIDSGASNYAYGASFVNQGGSVASSASDQGSTYIAMTNVGGDGACGNAAGEGANFVAYLLGPGDSTMKSSIRGSFYNIQNNNQNFECGIFSGHRATIITHDRILFQFISGNIATGRMTVWGIAHA